MEGEGQARHNSPMERLEMLFQQDIDTITSGAYPRQNAGDLIFRCAQNLGFLNALPAVPSLIRERNGHVRHFDYFQLLDLGGDIILSGTGRFYKAVKETGRDGQERINLSASQLLGDNDEEYLALARRGYQAMKDIFEQLKASPASEE